MMKPPANSKHTFFHGFVPCRYTAWSSPVDGYGANRVQFKRCVDCGKIRYRKIGYAQQITANAMIGALDERIINDHFEIIS